jgi:Ca2+-binding EF-hand superfamily protein
MQKLFELMDTDKSGKVSKAEFMKFMENEFDFADVDHDGQLDTTELGKLVG